MVGEMASTLYEMVTERYSDGSLARGASCGVCPWATPLYYDLDRAERDAVEHLERHGFHVGGMWQ